LVHQADNEGIGPDGLCSFYSEEGVKLTVRILEDDFVLIESDKEGLEFLSKLLLSVSVASDKGFQISPKGAGNILFKKNSSHGIYIHRRK